MPDFIIIGAMKCATSTLHEQLALQPGLYMSTPKEPNFFSDDAVWSRGTNWYGSLFASASPEALCGESSTHYTKLPTHPHTVRRMREHLPNHVRFVYIMRDPIERLVSQYIHEWTQRVIDRPIEQAIEAHPELIAYSQYAAQLQPYLDSFGSERVLPVFFERLAREPEAELQRIGQFIGAGHPLRWDESLREQNASSERMRACGMRDAIVNFPGMAAIRRRLVPRSWRDQVKKLWMMKRRPQLSDSTVTRLRDIFDRDLETLGQWLGVPLTSNSFKSIAARTAPQWPVQTAVMSR